jgi:pre-peptidase
MRQRRAAVTTTVVVAAGMAIITTVGGSGAASAAPARVGPTKQFHGTVTTAQQGNASQRLARDLGFQIVPKRPGAARKAAAGVAPANPLTSLLRDPAKTDMSYWRAKMAAQARQRAEQRATARKALTKAAAEPLLVDEQEPDAVRGGNDTPANAQLISTFGTGSGKRPLARILGTQAPPATPSEFEPVPEDNGSIPLAGETLVVGGSQRTTTGRIGDGPHGSAGDGTGDFDFYKFTGTKGQRLRVDIDARELDPNNALDTALILWDSHGEPIVSNDDSPTSLDSLLETTLPANDTYYVSVTNFDSLPADPFDSGSGSGATGEGDYRITFGLNASDIDYYAVNLKAGDVLSGTVKGVATTLSVLNPSKTEVFGSSQDASSIYPANTKLTGGGNATVDHVAATSGKYYVGVTGGVGNYDVDLEVFRPGLEAGGTQTIFLDLDGQKLNTAIVGGRGVTTLSPLSAFLGRWGIPASQQNALTDRIVSTVTENLKRDFAGTGVAVKVLNSRDNADPFGKANVSRLIIGGTIEESGVDTIGISQSIDPGNFATAETALILLDVVSGSVDEAGDASFNWYINASSDKVKFVGTALGNIASHEAGHYLGNWHVDQFNNTLNLMDQGGNFPLLYGVGDDGVGGTADDPDVDFGPDTLNPNEGFTGIENTRARTQWGLHGRAS